MRPASEFDEVLAEKTRETLGLWRYAPQMKDGEPVETTLQWTIQFSARDKTDEEQYESVNLEWRRHATSESTTADLQRKLMSMKLEQRAVHLKEQAEIALGHMNEESTHAINSYRFALYSDVPKTEGAQAASQNLEATFNIVQDILGPGVAPQYEPYRVVALMYARRSGFEKLKRDIRGIEWAAGFYYPAGLLAFHAQMPSGESLVSVLVHESTHAYLDRYVSRPGVVLPRWLHEGFAEYMGNSKIRKGQLIPGRTRKGELYRGPWGSHWGAASHRYGVLDLKKAVRKRSAIRLEQLIVADPEVFYGEQRSMLYTMAWLLVHFLRHGEDNWATERFPDLVLYLAEGYPVHDVFTRIYGDPAELEEEFYEYVLSF
jgi:hypothetical protein